MEALEKVTSEMVFLTSQETLLAEICKLFNFFFTNRLFLNISQKVLFF